MTALWEIACHLRLPVFPCSAAKKAPTCPDGFYAAESDPRRIRALFLEHPGDLIGVPTGHRSGFDALDLDTARHPREVHSWLQRNVIPETRGHQTRSGGYHFLFRAHPTLRCSNGNPLKGIDIRAEGGYIVYWPAHGFAVRGRPILEWPEELVRQWLKPPKTEYIPLGEIEPISDAKLQGVVRRVGTAKEGERNSILFWAACRIGEWIKKGEMNRPYGERLLLLSASRSGLDAISSQKTIASGLRTTGV